jgi:DNA-binding Xre family transcriptional regulator
MSETMNKNVENHRPTKTATKEVDVNKFGHDLKSKLSHIKEMEASDKIMEDKNNNWTVIDEKISQFRIDWKINVNELSELKSIAENELNSLKAESKNNITAHKILIKTIDSLIKTADVVNFSDFKSELESNFKLAKFKNAFSWSETKDFLTSYNPFSKEKWAIWKAYDNYTQTNNYLEEFTKYSA